MALNALTGFLRNSLYLTEESIAAFEPIAATEHELSIDEKVKRYTMMSSNERRRHFKALIEFNRILIDGILAKAVDQREKLQMLLDHIIDHPEEPAEPVPAVANDPGKLELRIVT